MDSFATAGVPLAFGGVTACACGPLVVLFGGRRVLDTSVGLLPLPELEEGALAAATTCTKGRGVSDLAALTTGKVAPAPVFRPGGPGFGRLVALPLAFCFGSAELAA